MSRNNQPDPQDLLSSAEKMPEKVSLGRYWESVSTLREKGYSWREVSEWLEKHGLKVHHSQLHRYAKRREAGLEDEEDEQ